MKPLKLLECISSLEDDGFDLIYPPEIRDLSPVHWTPVIAARLAAGFLVRAPGTRVLDIGCGPGKFCIVGALTTTGEFTGVEQRKRLCDAARAAIENAGIANAEIVHGNLLKVDFSKFDAFYLFNPFQENLKPDMRIDASVNLSSVLYESYTEHVAEQLAMAPLGTRVATYHGPGEVIPSGYECLESALDHGLQLWEKTSEQQAKTRLQAALPNNGKWRFSLEAAS